MSANDVIVVGGGPAGAATATFLAGEGMQVLLFDRARFPRPKPCAEYLSPQAGRLLAALGVLDAVTAQSVALTGMEVRAPSGARITGDFAAVHGFRPFSPHGLAIPRVVLDDLLLRRAKAAGVTVIEGERVSDLTYDKPGRVSGVVSLGTDTAPRVHAARLTIGADGLRSVVARRAQLAHNARWPRRVAFVTHYKGVSAVGSRGEMLVTPDGYLGIAAVGAGATRCNVSLVLDHNAVARYRTAGTDASGSTIANWIRSHPEIALRFTQAERLTPVLSTGPFAARARRAWQPGLALVGDAADFFDPFTGEGMYSALLGGESLAQHAVRYVRDGRTNVLRDYERWRRSEFSAKWRVERIIARVVARPWLMERAARAFASRPDMAHTLVGVTGDFVPAREVLRPSYIAQLLRAAFSRTTLPVADVTAA